MFIPKPDAKILLMNWRFHRELWCLKKEKFSYTPRKKKKSSFSVDGPRSARCSASWG